MSKSVITVDGSDLTIILERVAALYPNIRTMTFTIELEDDDPRGYLRVAANNGPEYVAVGTNAAVADPVTQLQKLATDFANGRVGHHGNEREILALVMSLLGPAYDKLVTG